MEHPSTSFEVSRGSNWNLYDFTNDLTAREFGLARPKTDSVEVGQLIKLNFELDPPIPLDEDGELKMGFESMWAEVTAVHGEGNYSARLDNEPGGCDGLHANDIIHFNHRHLFPVPAEDETADRSTINPLSLEELLELRRQRRSSSTD